MPAVSTSLSLQPSCWMWTESPFTPTGPTGAHTRCLSVPSRQAADHSTQAAGNGTLFSFTLQTVGGVAWPAAGITWQIENASAGRLSIAQLGEASARLVLQFPMQLFPGAVVLPGSGNERAYVLGITADGRLFCVDLDVSHGRLWAVQEQHVRFLDISTQWSSLGSPTQLVATAEHVAVGGSNGMVLCLSASTLVGPAAAQHLAADLAAGQLPAGKAFILKESSWGIKSLIAGAWQRARSPAVVSLMHVPGSSEVGANAAGMLLAVYDDCSLRGFNLSRQCQVFADMLPGCSQTGKRSMPVHASLFKITSSTEHGAGLATQAALIAQLEASDTLQKSVHLVVLSFPASGGKPSLRHHLELASPPQASVVSSQATEQAAWVLYQQADGSNSLVRYTLTGDGQPVGVAQLVEHSMLAADSGTAALGDAMALAIWEELLSSLSSDSASRTLQQTPVPDVAVVQQQVLSRLLPPGALDADVLCTTLRQQGLGVSQMEVEGASRPQLQGMLAAAVEVIQRKTPTWSQCRCWAQLLIAFQDAWSRAHPLLSLVSHPQQPDCILTLRGAGLHSLLRQASVVEALAAPLHLSNCVPNTSCTLVTLPQPLAAVHTAVRQLSSLLGSWAQDVFLALVLCGADPCAQLAPKLVDIILMGGMQRSGPEDDISRMQRSNWRRQRQQVLLQVSGALAGLSDAASAIREYCHLLELHNQDASQVKTAATWPLQQPIRLHTLPATVGPCLCEATKQLAAGQAAACRCALLLVSMLSSQQSGGMALSVPHQAQATLKTSVMPQLSDLSLRAALLAWLGSTAATAVQLQSHDEPPQTALAGLRLGSSGPPTPQAAHTPRARTPEYSLLGQLLASLSPQLGLAKINLPQCGKLSIAASVLLQYAPTGLPNVQLQDTLLLLGYWLFAAQEQAALLGLSKLAAGARSAAIGSSSRAVGRDVNEAATGLWLLHGLSLVGSLRSAPAEARSDMVSEASACFFRAAACLHTGSGPLLIQVLQQLTAHLTGSPATPLAAPLSPEQITGMQLQLYEVAMQVFEREDAPNGALTFARAALQLTRSKAAATGAQQAGTQLNTDVDMLNGGASLAEPSSPGRAEMLGPDVLRQSRLWSNIFTYSCQLKAWEDAYAALVCNPDAQEGIACLRKLVLELCEAGALDVLCALPFAGAVQVPDDSAMVSGAGSFLSLASGGRAPTTLVTYRDEAVAALQRRAINSDLSARPQPYRVLYDFLVSRTEYREAAAAMLAYARRLRQDGAGSANARQAVLIAYELAIHCLSLVGASDAWLDLGSTWLAAHPMSSAAGASLFAGADASASQQPICITLAQLRQEHALVRAAVQGHSVGGPTAGADPLQRPLSTSDMLAQLLATRQFANAEQLCRDGLAPGSPAASDAWQQLVSALASAAAHAQLHGSQQVPQPLGLLSMEPQEQQLLLGCSHLASPAGPLWNKLRLVLQAHMQPHTGLQSGIGDVLRYAAADAVLRVDRRMTLPVWLEQLFTEPKSGEPQHGMAVCGCGPAQLLEVYMAHERLRDAVQLVVACLAGWSSVDARQRTRHAEVWYPHTRIKVLRGRLVSEVEHGSSTGGALLAQLDAALSAHADLLAQDGEHARAAAAGTGPMHMS